LADFTPTKKIWTILDLITWGTTYLTEKGFDEARLSIELLTAHVLQLQRIQLYTNFDRPLTDDELARFKDLLKKRLNHEPLQYIFGTTEFMGFTFHVNPSVFIPRPDTELLVEKAVEKIAISFAQTSEIRILEIGTGSGCIAVSLARLIPSALIVAVDNSEEALHVAKKNAEHNNVADRISFVQEDFLHMTGDEFEHHFHCLIANPPYISVQEYDQLAPEVKEYEPKTALCDDGDGLKFYHHIAIIAQKVVGQNGCIAVEHSYDQSEDVQKIFHSYHWVKTFPIKDYGGHFRCVVAERGEL
jgi:release factor glutamine methyltransferase